MRAVALEDALTDATIRDRYWAKVVRTGSHWWWTGAIMRSGHGRFWITRDTWGRNHVVIAHRVGYALAHGASALVDASVLRHTCDEPLCQRPDHLVPAADNRENHLEWLLRRHRIGSPLRDTRGRAGRSRAIRDALLAGDDLTDAMSAGMPDLDRDQPTLF